MIIIGEKINGTIPGVKRAIQERDEQYIVNLAVKQAEAGADYIDICAGTMPEFEIDTLNWLMEIVQEAVEKPLCIDSPNPKAIEAVFDKAKVPGIINSVSGEEGKCEVIFPLVQGTEWDVIALTCDNSGIPADVESRVEITKQIMDKAQKYSIDPARIHIDPLVMALATDNSTFVKFLDAMQQIKKLYPSVKVTSGLSNISFGMPLRKAVNQSFLTIALSAGMDSAIMDPCNKEMMAALFATEALLGRDKFCRNYNKAYRKGIIKY
jgi:5-methyltetrahydrofolate--homocysteine methyltransferase